jgi:hypothetical protein
MENNQIQNNQTLDNQTLDNQTLDNQIKDKQLIGQAKQFDEQINDIKTRFFSALDDFKKYYVYYNKNPEVDEFQSYYANSKGQLQSMSKELFMTTNNIDKNIDSLDNEMSEISVKLANEKKLNKELLGLLTNLKNTQNGSEVLIDDSKREYNMQYYKNVEIFIGILIVGGLLGTLFKQKVIPLNK